MSLDIKRYRKQNKMDKPSRYGHTVFNVLSNRNILSRDSERSIDTVPFPHCVNLVEPSKIDAVSVRILYTK